MDGFTWLKLGVTSVWHAITQRRLLSYLKQKAWTSISDRHADIWILGRPGVGKTSILRMLSDDVKGSSTPPMTSLRTETGVLLLGRSYAQAVRVAPGQPFVFERIRDDFKQSLSANDPETLMYVVDFGYNFRRELPMASIPGKSVEEQFAIHRQAQLNEELDHLSFISGVVREIPRVLLKVRNIIVVLNKIDLMSVANRAEAEIYYNPASDSAFARSLKTVVEHIGRKELGLHLLTCCAWPLHQKFLESTIATNFDQTAQRIAREDFVTALDNILE